MKDAKQFTGNENHAITTAGALTFIKHYREHYGTSSAPGVFFDNQAVQAILDQADAVGLRYYYGLDKFDRIQLVLVGTSTKRDDLLEGEPLKVSIMNPPLTAHGVYNRESVSHEIPLRAAAELTTRYQENLPAGQPKGGFFGKKAMQRLLDSPGTVGLRFSFGAKNDGTRVVVIFCVDKYGSEMFYGAVAELSIICPPICGRANLLNGGKSTMRKLSGAVAF